MHCQMDLTEQPHYKHNDDLTECHALLFPPVYWNGKINKTKELFFFGMRFWYLIYFLLRLLLQQGFGGGAVKSKRAKERWVGGKREGEERREELQTGVRPLQGAGGQWGGMRWGSRGWGKEREVAVVAMEMTRNVPFAPGCPYRLMGREPRSVPHNCWFREPKCHLECQQDSGMSECSWRKSCNVHLQVSLK